MQSSSRKSSQAGFSTEKKSGKDIIYFNFTILSYQSCPKDDNLILETILKLAEATVTFFACQELQFHHHRQICYSSGNSIVTQCGKTRN